MFYAVHKGRTTGIFSNWEDCKRQIHKFPNCKLKKFKCKSAADFFVQHGKIPTTTVIQHTKDGLKLDKTLVTV